MQKIRITQAGMETYSGPYFGVVFVDGLSEHPVTARQAAQIANIISAKLEDESNPSDSQSILNNANTAMSTEMQTSERYAMPAPMQVGEPPVVHTRESLEKIADEKGIAGIREIADPLNIKNTSIVKLIAQILAHQSPAAPTEAPVELTPEAPAATEAPATESTPE